MPLPTLSITIAGLVALLGQRLGAVLSGTDYWNSAELELYVRCAIREFQCLTSFWRDQIPFTVALNTPFYDVSALSTETGYNVADLDVVSQVAYHLLEFVTGSEAAFINTDQFTLAAVVAALDQRREEILGKARMVVTDFSLVSPSLTAGRFTLPNSVLQVHRLDWKDSVSGNWGRVDRSDEMAASGWVYGWQGTPALPQAYSSSIERPFVLQLIPAPVNAGTAELLATVSNPYSGTPVPGGSATVLGLPDDSTWALVWGMLASLLDQDAKSRDYQRATYARSRFQAALTVLGAWPMVEQVEFAGGLSVNPSSLDQLDRWNPGWRNTAVAEPTAVAVGGRNIVAVSPVPDTTYNFTMDAVVNSPASGSDSSAMDVTSDIVTALLDNSQQLACFKIGGDQFMQTIPLYGNFLTVAQNYVSRLRAQTINFEALRKATLTENANIPYEVASAEAPVGTS